MRRSLERVWSASLELEALEQEVMRHSPDRGPRDRKVTAAATELTTSAPAACVRACLCVGGSSSVCARACRCVCAHVDVHLSAYVGGRVYVSMPVCMCAGGYHGNVPVHVRPVRKLSFCVHKSMPVGPSICLHVCWWGGRGRAVRETRSMGMSIPFVCVKIHFSVRRGICICAYLRIC